MDSTPRLKPLLPLLLLVWFASTLFLLGELGYWNDDYFFAQVDPETRRPTRWYQVAASPFEPPGDSLLPWRPLHQLGTTALISSFFSRPAIVHAVGAVLHLVVTLLLWAFLKRIGRTPQACAAGALLFVACPVHFEVPLWASTFTLAPACAFTLLAFITYADRASGQERWWTTPLLVVSGILIVGFHEQPAACLGALPLLALACRPNGERLATTIWRGSWPLAIIACAYAIYLCVIATTLPPTTHGSASSLTSLANIPTKAQQIVREMGHAYRLEFLGLGAFKAGWWAIREHWPLALALAVGLFAAAWVFVPTWLKAVPSRGAPNTSSDNDKRRRAAWLVAFGLGVSAFALVPLIAISFVTVRPRMTYAVFLGVAITIAVLGDAAWATCSTRRRAARAYYPLAGMLLAGVLALGVLAMIGVQYAMRSRSRVDERGAAMLRSQVPSPAPGSVFLPLLVENRVFDTGTGEFDWFLCSPWYFSWGFPTFVRHAYGRCDLHSMCFDWRWPWIETADAQGASFRGPVGHDFPRDTDGLIRATWDRVVAFTVELDGSTPLVTTIRIERVGAETLVIELPQGIEAVNAGRAERREFTVRLGK